MITPGLFNRHAAHGARKFCVALGSAVIVGVVGCGRAGRAPESPPASIPWQANKPVAVDVVSSLKPAPISPQSDDLGADHVAHLERLLKRSRFDVFVDAALNAADEAPGNAAVELLRVEALLAVGRAQDAEAVAQSAVHLALDAENYQLASQALKRWTIARFRTNEPLEGPWFDTLAARFPQHDPTITMLRFWSDSLGQRTPYGVSDTGGGPHEVAPAPRSSNADSAQVNAITARVNGVMLDTVFIDTGAQHVVMTLEAAEAAGVRPGLSGLRLVGFANLAARPGMIDTLDLGGIVLHYVPVLIGDSAPLAAAGGQMALGTELMHHLRFTIDYPAHRVIAEPAKARLDAASADAWEIPLWTFSQVCLAQGHLPSGATARVLVDTGDGSGTYVSSRWAHRHLPGFPRSRGPVVFKNASRKLSLDKMDLGTSSLADWPVVDTLPSDLERVDAVDVLVGRDLLASYRVTIDMNARVLRLRPAGASPGADEN